MCNFNTKKMEKVNLDAFKMSKAQMNNVNGGRQIKCNITC